MSDPGTITVHVVDDDDSMRAALCRLLAAAGYDARGYGSAGDFLLAIEVEPPQGCLLLDLHLPGPDGQALHEALRRRGLVLPTVFLSGRGDIASSVRALKSGASDFLTKPVQAQPLLDALRAALADDAPRRTEHARRQALGQRLATLTERERVVLRAVVQGVLTKQIADRLGVSERTVKSCRATLMDKLGVASLPELVILSTQLPD